MGDAEIKIRVGARLKAAAEYVAVSSYERGLSVKDVVCADVGCDHGYLSIYLIEKNIAGRVYATDINEGPVRVAEKNIRERDTRGKGLCEKISISLCDGLDGLSDKALTHAIICGMGGEVIYGILDRAELVRHNEVSLVLQPMSGEYELREWLSENGFLICDERLLRDAGRIYAVMHVRYTGEKYEYSPSELILGRKNIEKGGELLCELCERKLVHARNLLKQRDVSQSDALLERELSELLLTLKK